MMKLYNTLTRQTEEVIPRNPPQVSVYTCGPTVYDYPHVGNWFTFIRYDVLVRSLTAAGYEPTWVMNLTDVGHLVGDADEGEDKLEKGARREGKTAWDVAKFYGDYFIQGLERLNITTPAYIPKATEHITEQIELIQALEQKGYTYVIDDGVYYDTSKFEGYAAFARLDLDDLQAGARVEFNQQKRSPSDFALWKFSPADQQRDMEWWAPWSRPGLQSDVMHKLGQTRDLHSSEMQGADEQQTEAYAAESATQQHAENARTVGGSADEQSGMVHGSWGFPGWHIECSAMSMKYLGETIDIHSGGIDHVPVHHTNEIAQSEAATGKRFANHWMHTNHISVNGEKISKSLGNGITLEDIEAKGYSLEVFRLHVLESHYRSRSKFSWDALEAAKNRLTGYTAMAVHAYQANPDAKPQDHDYFYEAGQRIHEALTDDLNTPHALAILSEVQTTIETTGLHPMDASDFEAFIANIDKWLGTKLAGTRDISDTQKQAIQERASARIAKDWAKSDEIRDQLAAQGIGLRDTPYGAIWYYLLTP